MRVYKLIDLFCGAGGCTAGYVQAGFAVSGVDLKPQPHYPFPHLFHQMDALRFLENGYFEYYDAIHASPPCQAHCSLNKMWNAKKHNSLIETARTLLSKTGKPWVMENVVGAPLNNPVLLCGSMFGLKTRGAELRRHRLFETSFPILERPICQHGKEPRVIGVYGGHGRDRRRTINTQDFPVYARKEAMGINWMSGSELSQAIPPEYTKWIGFHLKNALDNFESGATANNKRVTFASPIAEAATA
jgi:DNA (cytosine-5)-methyltransferase 1